MSPARKVAKKAAKKVAKKAAKKVAKTKASTAAKGGAGTGAKTGVKKSARTGAVKTTPAAKAAMTDAQREARRAAAKLERRSRAAMRMAHVSEFTGQTDLAALTRAMHAELARAAASERPAPVVAPAAAPRGRAAAGRRMAQAVNNRARWVPIGPSVVRRGQADGRPRVTGRVRDLAVSANGQRAYAASGKAGVWYTEDAGTSWRPVGGWVSSPGRLGGASTDLSCGCLLVEFGATAADDYVMVGTGEVSAPNVAQASSPTHLHFGGRGVLAGRAPVTRPETASPFEDAYGLAEFENAGIYRLVRDPARRGTPQVAGDGDRVLAATTQGLFLGTRVTVAGVKQWSWARLAGLDTFTFVGDASICDVAWIPVAGLADGRIVIAAHGLGIGWSDQLGADGSWTWVPRINLYDDNVSVSGRCSLSDLVGDHMYVLIGTDLVNPLTSRTDEPWVYRLPTVTAPRVGVVGGPGAAVVVRGVPSMLWGRQREWDQAIFAERVGTADRVWIGGSAITPYTGADWSAQLYCFDVIETGAGAPRLGPATGVSRPGIPPAGEGANRPGLVGNSVHSDVHAIRVVTTAAGARHVWVGCDGGVYVSEQGGRVNTFQSRATGLAAIEAGFVAMHPTSSHFCALGAQDNGVQVRTGDTMWEVTQLGDGGGLMFHPTASQYLVSQYVESMWYSTPTSGFRGPTDRVPGGGAQRTDRECKASAFYSGCDAILNGASGRIALGTNRVWISDNLGAGGTQSWRVIPYGQNPRIALTANDPRPGGGDAQGTRTQGVPAGALGSVVQVRWATPTRLYVVYRRGILRHDQDGAGKWTTRVVLVPGQAGAPDTTTVRCTDLWPIPESDDFYVTTLGDSLVLPAVPTDTCWHCSVPPLPPPPAPPAVVPPPPAPVFTATLLRRRLDVGGVLGPLDPAHAVCVDPDHSNVLFVGTIGGIWRGVREVNGTWTWNTHMNGLPVTCVSDIRIWKDPAAAADSPLLLRAATQSRGVWETLLLGDEPQRTYLRVHARDDRRWPVSRLANPMLAPAAPPVVTYASPDVVVRPARRPAASGAVRFPLATGASLGASSSGSYHLWTFQTAFRWLFPSIRADGLWSDQFADLLYQYRATQPLLTPGNRIDRSTWDLVVGQTRLTPARAVTTAPGDGWAVYETPWQTSAAGTVIGTEIDVAELVVPLSVNNGIWRVYAERSTVDVLLHHRDTRPLAANDAYAVVFWKSAPTSAALQAERASAFAPLHAWNGTGAVPTPATWTATPIQRLPATLDAFMPRAVSVDIDLTGVALGHHVMFVAICGSSVEVPPAPSGLAAAATIGDMVCAWPRSAARLVEVVGARP